MSQKDDVLNLLISQGPAGVTPMQAEHEIGTMRLAARINELRNEGHSIVDVGFKTLNGRHVSRYVLVPVPAEPMQLRLVVNE